MTSLDRRLGCSIVVFVGLILFSVAVISHGGPFGSQLHPDTLAPMTIGGISLAGSSTGSTSAAVTTTSTSATSSVTETQGSGVPFETAVVVSLGTLVIGFAVGLVVVRRIAVPNEARPEQ